MFFFISYSSKLLGWAMRYMYVWICFEHKRLDPVLYILKNGLTKLWPSRGGSCRPYPQCSLWTGKILVQCCLQRSQPPVLPLIGCVLPQPPLKIIFILHMTIRWESLFLTSWIGFAFISLLFATLYPFIFFFTVPCLVSLFHIPPPKKIGICWWYPFLGGRGVIYNYYNWIAIFRSTYSTRYIYWKESVTVGRTIFFVSSFS